MKKVILPTIFCFLLGMFSVLTYAAVDEDTVAIWLFDEGSGETVKDSSGKGHDGNFVGDINWVKGKWGNALDFSGEEVAYVEIPHADDLSLMEWSIEAWLNIRSLTLSWHCPFAKETADPAARNYALYIQGDGIGIAHGSISVGNAMGHATFGGINIADGKWHHIAATYDGNICTVYVDGEEDFEHSVGGDADGEIGSPPDTNEGPITIGVAKGDSFPIDGMVDEIRLSSKARTADEIRQSMNNSFAAVYPAGKLATTWANIKQ